MTRNEKKSERDRHLAYHLRRLEDEILFYRDPPKKRKKTRIIRTRHYLIENGSKRKRFSLKTTRQHRRRRELRHHDYVESGIISSQSAVYLILFGLVGGLIAYFTMVTGADKVRVLDECVEFYAIYPNRTNLTELAVQAESINNDTVCSPFANCMDPNDKVMGDVTCTCIDGFYGNGKNCTDFDECGLMTDECNEDDEVCKNAPGNYTCETCSQGWIKESGANYCSDINECSNSTLFDCGEDNDLVCNNNDGSYSCDGCHTGYTYDYFAGYTHR